MEDKQIEQAIQIPPSMAAQFGEDEEWQVFSSTVRNITNKGDMILGDVYYKNIALMVKRDIGSEKWTAYNITTKTDVHIYTASRYKKRKSKR